jgi:hypothetical protein
MVPALTIQSVKRRNHRCAARHGRNDAKIPSRIPQCTQSFSQLLSGNEGVQFDTKRRPGKQTLPLSEGRLIGMDAIHDDRNARPGTRRSRRQQGIAMSFGRVDDRRRRGIEQQQRRGHLRRSTRLLVAACTVLVALTGGGGGFGWGISVDLGFVGPRGISGFRFTRDHSSRSRVQDAPRFRRSSTFVRMLLEDVSVGCKEPKMRFEPPERVLIHWR